MAEEEGEKETKVVGNTVFKLPSFFNQYKEYQGHINPKIISNFRNQFESDPNACVIKDAEIQTSDSDDSNMSIDNQDNDANLTQTTLKLRFLMERYKIKEESLLGDALIQDSMKSYIQIINKSQGITKQFKEQSEGYRRERDDLCNLSTMNVIPLHFIPNHKEKSFDFGVISKQRKEMSELSKKDDKKTPESTQSGSQNKADEKKKGKVKQWQLEINCLNHTPHDEFFQRESNDQMEKNEFLEKFRLNKQFEFNLHGTQQNTISKAKSKYPMQDQMGQGSQPQQERYQDKIFSRLPKDIDTIQKHVVEYIDLTGQGNLQPQNLVELKGDLCAAIGKSGVSQKENMFVLQTKAVYEDQIETFSAVIEENDGINLNLLTFQRQISPISRQVIKSNVRIKAEQTDEADMIKNDENEINLDELKDEDIMNIISGRIDQDCLSGLFNRWETYQNKIEKNQVSFEGEKGENKEEIREKLAEIKNSFLKNSKVNEEAQACIIDQKNEGLDSKINDAESDTASVSVRSVKSTKSNYAIGITPKNTSKSKSRSSQANNVLNSKSKNQSTNTGQQTNNINNNSMNKLTIKSSFSSSSSLSSRKLPNNKKDASPTQQTEKELFFETNQLLDKQETEHNTLLKTILAAQVHPRIYPIYQEVKNLRTFKKKILKTSDVTEAVQMTKTLNFHICSKLKEILMLIFSQNGETFEVGLCQLLTNLPRINCMSNTIDQGKLKLVFILLQQFRKSLVENHMDVEELLRQTDPDREIERILETLDKFHTKKSSFTKQEQKNVAKNLDFNKLSYFNFKGKKLNKNKSLKSMADSRNLSGEDLFSLKLNKKLSHNSFELGRKRAQTTKKMMSFSSVIGEENDQKLNSSQDSIDKHFDPKKFGIIRSKTLSSSSWVPSAHVGLIKKKDEINKKPESSPLPQKYSPSKKAINSTNEFQKNKNFPIKQQKSGIKTENQWNISLQKVKNSDQIATNQDEEFSFLEQPLQNTKALDEKIMQIKKQRAEELFNLKKTTNIKNPEKHDKVLEIVTNFESVLSHRSHSQFKSKTNQERESPSKKKEMTTSSTSNSKKKMNLSIKKFDSASTAISSQILSPKGILSTKSIREPKLQNKSSNIFEYLSKEQARSQGNKLRKDIYHKGESSAEIIRKNLQQVFPPNLLQTRPFAM